MTEHFLWRYGWFRRLMTPTYQCPECRHSYHYCNCHGPLLPRWQGRAEEEDVHQCRSCDQRNDAHTIGCPMHPDYDPDRDVRCHLLQPPT
jgi:hypothetical protein